VAIEVLRRWEVAELQDAELTDVLAHCWHVLDALLIYVAELVQGETPEAPSEFVSTVRIPECMVSPNPSLLPLVIEADTGTPYGADFVQEPPRDKAALDEAADRYRARRLPLPSMNDTLPER